MDIITYDDEIKLKRMLNDCGFRYGEIGCNDKFVIYFRDIKSGAPISQGIYDSPIVALRDLSVIVPQIKINIDEIMCQLLLCFNPSDGSKKPMQFNDVVCLSPYLYYKKKEIKNNEISEISVNSEVSEDNTK